MPAVFTSNLQPNLADVEAALAYTRGGGNGFLRALGKGLVTETSPVSLQVDVATAVAFIALRVVRKTAVVTMAAIVPPTGGSAGDLRRIDLVQLTRGSSGFNIKTGVEDAAPVAPTLDANSIEAAQLHLRKGMASIKNTDDATNGFIVTTGRVFT